MDNVVFSTFCEKQKNEEKNSVETNVYLNTMKPKYYTNEQLNSGSLNTITIHI